MAGKRNGDVLVGKRKAKMAKLEGRLPVASERTRNRASPSGLVKLYEFLSDDQKEAIELMQLGSMLKIRCTVLHNSVINWLAPKYDRFSRSFVIPGRGKIPLNAESVYRTMGLPRGEVPVTYAVDSAIEKRLAPVLFPGLPSTPETTKLFTILKDMKEADESFKQVWIMYLVSTVVAPTSRNRVSNSCYPIMDKVDEVKNMNICQFVCDRLHEELSVGKLSAACLLQIMLMYVDSLDISALNIELPEGPFVVNVWSKELIGTVLDADMKRDLSGFGNLELKPHLAIDHMFFGGPEGFQSWIDTNTSLDCPKPRKEKVTRLVGDFVSGMTRLLSTLVQGWTEVDECDALVVEQSLGNLSDQFGLDGAPYADIPCRTPPAFAPTTDIIADKPSSSVPIDSNTIPSSNLVITRSASKKSACAGTKGIFIKTPTVNRNVSFEDPIADIVSPRLTRSASSKMRVSYTPDDVGDSGGSQDGKSASSDNDSEYAEEEDADRFIIESRVAKAGKTIPGGDCSSAKHNVDLSLNFSMPTQSFNVHSSYEPVESYTKVETAAPKFTVDGKSMCIIGNLGDTESSQGIVGASVKEPEIANPVIIAGKDHTDDGEVDGLDGMTDVTNVIQKEAGLVSNAAFLVDACKVTETASVDGLADLSYLKKEHYTRQKKRKVEDRLKEDNASILFKKQKASAAKLIRAGKRQTHQGTRSSPRFLSKQRVGGLADETTSVINDVLKGFVSDSSTTITTSVGADCSTRDGSKTADVSIVNEDNTSTLFNALPSAPHDNAENDSVREETSTENHDVKAPNLDGSLNYCQEDDVQILYATPALPAAALSFVPSTTPRTKLRMGRVIHPSKFLLPPYCQIVSNPEQDELYEQVIKHTKNCEESKIKGSIFLEIAPMWVNTADLAESVMPSGEMSATVAEIGISVLQDNCKSNKILFPWIVTVYLLESKFTSKLIQHHFRRDEKYKLSHQDIVMFAVLQELGTVKKPCGHWYALSLNFKAKRFEVLDSVRGNSDETLINHATALVDAIKEAYKINYSSSSKQIDDYELVYIDAPKQRNTIDCGYFMLKFLELWDGRNVPAITYDQIPAFRKVLTWIWLHHPRNKLKGWKYLLEKNRI